ncbi:putative O-glycosylation ligase, exosortase A system-associated [Massilia yuzhufengensis]|uniref:Probable O-glycosylation ligase, exosortase A-associated n=1 Tax=Massilia yuzhufengensis TaxID=1164594 RepID=A0A1I1DIQ1_9BURK|nr:putative O-glycosylation ligase, exosortase A system-associated [Massilia yuzhufengensis]SFB74714.1 probable O-glycosylation ligase, exosortase A-associated [Massilia yuzhufengensis]
MRDIVITLIVLGSLPFALKRPWIGVLMWVWISVMNPHRLSWGFAYDFPFAAIIAGVTLVGVVITRDPKKLPVTPITVTLIMFTLWMNLTTLFAFYPESAQERLSQVNKIMLMTLVTGMMIKTRRQIECLAWALMISIGYYGTKGGLFTILTGGGNIVWGPSGSLIEGNNEVALAFITIIPIMFYLRLVSQNKWVRRALAVSMPLCAAAAIGSYSRGALLGVAAMLFFLWIKSPKKLVPGIVMVLMIPVAIAFMPDKWTERMDTINEYQSDASAMGRINAWKLAVNLANDRPLVGGGFELWKGPVFAKYAPDPEDPHAAHSIYFQALGEHGWVGFLLYMTLGFLTWRKGSWIIRKTEKLPELHWAKDLATMLQVSMVGFSVGGAFLSLVYYDVQYYLMMTMVATGVLVEKHLAEQKTGTQHSFPDSRQSLRPKAVTAT